MINKDIRELAEKVLDSAEVAQILSVIEGIKNGDRKDTLGVLAGVLGVKPKRPLYYIAHAISELPAYGTRDVIRYSGDYIDNLIKFTLEDKKFFSRWLNNPLGPNIKKLKQYIDPDLHDHLVLFNKIYTQAKHEFHHDKDVSFFDYEDAVHVIYITKKISQKILPISERARDYNNQGKTFYRYIERDY